MRGSHRVFKKLCKIKWISCRKIKTKLVQLPKGRKSLKNKWLFKWLRDMVEENAAKLKKIHINKNVSNMLIKVVPK